MGVIFESGYALPGGDTPMTHARIAHSGNWLTGATISASTTDTDYFEDASDTSLTYEKWKPTSLPSTAATWEANFGGAQSADYCVIAAHNLGTTGCTFKVQSWNGSSWVNRCALTAIADDMPIMVIFEPVAHTKYRVQVSVGANPEIGVIKFGVALQLERAMFGSHAPIDMARSTQNRSTKSETGEVLGKTKLRTMLASDYQWRNLTSAWVRANWLPFIKAAEAEPFFIAWRPADFSEVAFAIEQSFSVPTNMGVLDFMQVGMSVKAYGYD